MDKKAIIWYKETYLIQVKQLCRPRSFYIRFTTHCYIHMQCIQFTLRVTGFEAHSTVVAILHFCFPLYGRVNLCIQSKSHLLLLYSSRADSLDKILSGNIHTIEHCSHQHIPCSLFFRATAGSGLDGFST